MGHRYKLAFVMYSMNDCLATNIYVVYDENNKMHIYYSDSGLWLIRDRIVNYDISGKVDKKIYSSKAWQKAAFKTGLVFSPKNYFNISDIAIPMYDPRVRILLIQKYTKQEIVKYELKKFMGRDNSYTNRGYDNYESLVRKACEY